MLVAACCPSREATTMTEMQQRRVALHEAVLSNGEDDFENALLRAAEDCGEKMVWAKVQASAWLRGRKWLRIPPKECAQNREVLDKLFWIIHAPRAKKPTPETLAPMLKPYIAEGKYGLWLVKRELGCALRAMISTSSFVVPSRASYAYLTEAIGAWLTTVFRGRVPTPRLAMDCVMPLNSVEDVIAGDPSVPAWHLLSVLVASGSIISVSNGNGDLMLLNDRAAVLRYIEQAKKYGWEAKSDA
jgi:hypothetical protein